MILYAVACASSPADDSGSPPAAWVDDSPPDAPGPYTAGTFEAAFVSTTGLTLPVQVWYPAADTDGAPALYDGFFAGTALDGPTPDCGDTRPVMMFSLGSGGIRYQSIYWTEDLATHGWIVVAPDLIGNTYLDDTADLDLMGMAQRRPVDIRDTYDWLLDTGGDGRLTGCFDPDAGYAMSGHSFGAFTTLALTGATIEVATSLDYCGGSHDWLCGGLEDYAAKHPEVTQIDLSDSRATLGIPMAPAGYELLLGGLPSITVPELVWGGTMDTLTPVDTQVRPIWEAAGGEPAVLALIEEAGHYTFSDACLLLPIFDDCEPPYLDAAVAHPIIATVSTAFLQHTQGVEAASAFLPPEGEPLLSWEER